jgi:hypothetical protein
MLKVLALAKRIKKRPSNNHMCMLRHRGKEEAMPEIAYLILMAITMLPVFALTTSIFYLYACAAWAWANLTMVNRKKGSADW